MLKVWLRLEKGEEYSRWIMYLVHCDRTKMNCARNMRILDQIMSKVVWGACRDNFKWKIVWLNKGEWRVGVGVYLSKKSGMN